MREIELISEAVELVKAGGLVRYGSYCISFKAGAFWLSALNDWAFESVEFPSFQLAMQAVEADNLLVRGGPLSVYDPDAIVWRTARVIKAGA